jgi:hypothetical protein
MLPEGSTDPQTSPSSLQREKTRLRWIGLVVLLVGFSSAGLVYWTGNRSEDSGLEQYKEAQTRAESRQMQMLYGTSGGVMEDFLNSLKRPGTQALAIAGITVLIAAGCFYLGRPLPGPDETQSIV